LPYCGIITKSILINIRIEKPFINFPVAVIIDPITNFFCIPIYISIIIIAFIAGIISILIFIYAMVSFKTAFNQIWFTECLTNPGPV